MEPGTGSPALGRRAGQRGQSRGTQPLQTPQVSPKNSCPQPKDPSSAFSLPLILLFKHRIHRATHPRCFSWEEGQCPASAKAPAWLEPDTHVGAAGASSRRGASVTARLKASSLDRSKLSGRAELCQLFIRAELRSSYFQHGGSQLPRRLSAYMELFVN